MDFFTKAKSAHHSAWFFAGQEQCRSTHLERTGCRVSLALDLDLFGMKRLAQVGRYFPIQDVIKEASPLGFLS